tara:strand:+ start:374 stop:529 length:156 start_codon:yes stop_codon:yes gene_type:complete
MFTPSHAIMHGIELITPYVSVFQISETENGLRKYEKKDFKINIRFEQLLFF